MARVRLSKNTDVTRQETLEGSAVALAGSEELKGLHDLSKADSTNLKKRQTRNQNCGHTPGRAFTPCCVFQVPEVLTSGSWNSGLELDDVVFQITITAT